MGSNHHDSFYRDFFSDPDLIRQLIQDFLPPEVSQALDISRMERIDTTFVGEHNQRRESDLIWKVYFKDGQPLYLYLLLEFQSTQDGEMPLRLLEYIILLYRTLIKSGQAKAQALPPVMPVVLYNGDTRWRHPTALEQMIQAPAFLKPWQPQFQFMLLDEGAFEPQQLEAMGTAVALLFEAEQAADRDQLIRAMSQLFKALEQLPNYQRLRRLLVRWLLRHAQRKMGSDAIIEQYLAEQREGVDMLAEKFVEVIKQEREQGLQEGLQKGLQQGVQKGLKEAAIRLHESGFSAENVASTLKLDLQQVKTWLNEREQ